MEVPVANVELPTYPVVKPKAEWNEQQINQLTELWNQGYSASYIGGVMNMTRNAIIGKTHRLKLTRRAADKVSQDGALTKTMRRKVAATKRPAKPPRERKPPAPPIDYTLNPNNPGVTIHELKWSGSAPSNCRAILTTKKDGARYCGEPNLDGESYCAGHCKIFFTKYAA